MNFGWALQFDSLVPVLSVDDPWAYCALLATIAAATLVTEDLTCIVVGLFVARGDIGFLPGTAACLVGIWVGDMMLYAAGRWLGVPLLDRLPLVRRWIHPDAVERSRLWLDRNGPVVVLTARALPGSRLPTYLASGVLRAHVGRFAAYFFVAALLWVPLLVALSVVFGEVMERVFVTYSRFAVPALLCATLVLWLVIGIGRDVVTPRGWRRLLARWHRWTRWEYWPSWIFYAPLLPLFLRLGRRHGGFTVCTAANPGIRSGGVIGESKATILDALHAPEPFGLPHRVLPAHGDAEDRMAALEQFMEEQAPTYPVVLKPDTGQRGAGVRVVRDEHAARTYLDQATWNVLVQPYVGGHEFGIFYIRHPDEAQGSIFSITEKRLPQVTGDGLHTLEDLVLRDSRAVDAWRMFSRAHWDRWLLVPDDGEVVRLVELGTHCLGATFLDGGRHRTPALEAAIDRISRGFDGFFFGRYDVKAPSVEALEEGRDFKVLELNGLTSEATHIYDPANSLSEAYRVLQEQWRQAYEIGAVNRDHGARVATVRELLTAWRDYRRPELE